MERTNLHRGIDNVTVHAIEHDIVLAQGIIFECTVTGKKCGPETELLNGLN